MASKPLLFDGFNDCLIGWTDSWMGMERPRRAVYCGQKLLNKLIEDSGMDPDEAFEYMEYNMCGAYVGAGTPVVVWQDDRDVTLEILDGD
jgi:hypothetical protein